MYLTSEELNKAAAFASKKELYDKVTALYGTLRTGSCAGCAKCCAESVNAFFVEFLCIWGRLEADTALKAHLMPKILRHYMLEMVTVGPCPFLSEQGRCLVYAQRPLTCRQFGHWSRREFEKNVVAVHRANEEAAAFYKDTYGMVLPEHVVNGGLSYCEDFEVAHKTGPIKRGEQADAIFAQDVILLKEGLMREELLATPLVSWFVYTILSPEDAGEIRLTVMREYLAVGHSETLEKLITSSSAGWLSEPHR